MRFRLIGLDPKPFAAFYGLSDQDLATYGVQRHVVTHSPGFPDRVEMRDLEPGETALLLNFVHQPADTPYRACHAIFVREGATEIFEAFDAVPEVMRRRPISLRAFTWEGEMIDADLAPGDALVPLIERFLANDDVAYLHAHYAKRGCYAARIVRA